MPTHVKRDLLMSGTTGPSASQSHAVRAALSGPRAARYQDDVPADHDPLDLYLWNANMSGAFWLPMHVCEVVIRNAAADALAAAVGPNWHAIEGFLASLPAAKPGRYNQRADLRAFSLTTVERAIVGVKFAFWEKLFVAARDAPIWNKQLRLVMPNLDPSVSVAAHRSWIHDSLNSLRKLRNRIAHHEPIYPRQLDAEYFALRNLVAARCAHTAEWMDQHQQVIDLYAQCPPVEANVTRHRNGGSIGNSSLRDDVGVPNVHIDTLAKAPSSAVESTERAT